MVDLNNTILLTTREGHLPPSREELSRALLHRYRGLEANWLLSSVSGGFLIQIPDWASQDGIEGDAEFCESHYHLLPLPWQTQNRTYPLSQSQLVDITIHNFPLDFWHPFYFRQAVAAMGVLTGISE